MFLTDSPTVVIEYLKTLPSSGWKPKKGRPSPTLYVLRTKMPIAEIFDTRKPEHMKVFADLAKISRRELGEDGFSKSDVMTVSAAPDSSLAGAFPSFGTVRTLLPMLSGAGFSAMIAGEGTQGASLAVWRPQTNVEIERIIRS